MSLDRIRGFAISKKPYSIDPQSFRATCVGEPITPKVPGEKIWHVEVDSVWFKRKQGVLGAHTGVLWDTFNQVKEPTLEDMLRLYDNGRYGGQVLARWDGEALWTQERMPRAEEDELIELLGPALANFPAPPNGYDGWFVATR